ncbi:putative DNA-directed RNA polymerase [Pseudomonas phage MR2]|uniref:Putative DNA-directed RNA polymerase n=1 Tax=Pseudomonas phage MR2 TaxID=2711170 RepID=A0A6M3TCK3_9CAUD|nr:putative DNA-directed RNA polymerase [Pseudomonas phage MR2]
MFGRNFEKNTRTTARRSFDEAEANKARKGKRNKPERAGRKEWSEE